MENKQFKELKGFHFRARLPFILRISAIGGLAAVILVVIAGFYYGSFRREFRMKGLPAELSNKVVAVVEGYERRESEDSVLRYTIRADRATTFDDRHQELENVHLEVFDKKEPGLSDKLRADKAIYVPDPSDSKDFRIFFAGSVVIDTRDRLNVRTEQLSYSKSSETAEAEEFVEFSRENLSGTSSGAVVKIEEKTLELLKEVEIFSASGGPAGRPGEGEVRTAELRAGNAFVDQKQGTVELKRNVDVIVVPEPGGSLERPTRITGDSATAFISERELRKIRLSGRAQVDQKPDRSGRYIRAGANSITAYLDGELERLEMSEAVGIETMNGGDAPATISADFAEYQRAADIFELDGRVTVRTVAKAEPTLAKASHAVYRQSAGEVTLTGNASIEQKTDKVGGDRIFARLHADRSLRSAEVTGNAYLRQESPERTTDIRSPELKAQFNRGGFVSGARSLGGTEIVVIPRNVVEYSDYRLKTAAPVSVTFGEEGRLDEARTQGRTTISLTAAGTGPNASDKTLTANSVSTRFRKGSDELESAEAVGDAELKIMPRAGSEKYRTEVASPKFVCDFFDANRVRRCDGTGRSRAQRIPLSRASARSVQELVADALIAGFDRQTQDIERLEAHGNARFSEAKRSGLAADIVYTTRDDTVRLRGGDPVLWDDIARIRANAIDWKVTQDASSYEGNVSATYYGQKKARGATPFLEVNSPVFVSSASASLDHKNETGLFSGDARAWQDKNYVRAERLLIEQRTGRFYAEGNVQSLLYDVKAAAGPKRGSSPVYAQAASLLYVNSERVLRYRNKVDIRQGGERITAGSAVVFLDESNELVRTEVEDDVVITQPGRRATGDYASYDASEETIVLRGTPATVRDADRGLSEGREVIVRLKDNVVVGTGSKGKGGAGRTRSVYKLKDGKLN